MQQYPIRVYYTRDWTADSFVCDYFASMDFQEDIPFKQTIITNEVHERFTRNALLDSASSRKTIPGFSIYLCHVKRPELGILGHVEISSEATPNSLKKDYPDIFLHPNRITIHVKIAQQLNLVYDNKSELKFPIGNVTTLTQVALFMQY